MNHKSNFAHSNASGCGYSNMNHGHSNMNHSNFVRGGNPNAIWSGAQTNVGPQDRIYAGNYASGKYSNFTQICGDFFDCLHGGNFDDICAGHGGWHDGNCSGGICTASCMDALTAPPQNCPTASVRPNVRPNVRPTKKMRTRRGR